MGGLREHIKFIRVGTLDDPDQLPPDVHIFTCSKQPWVILPKEDQRVDEFYNFKETWSSESIARLEQLEGRVGIEIAWRKK